MANVLADLHVGGVLSVYLSGFRGSGYGSQGSEPGFKAGDSWPVGPSGAESVLYHLLEASTDLFRYPSIGRHAVILQSKSSFASVYNSSYITLNALFQHARLHHCVDLAIMSNMCV